MGSKREEERNEKIIRGLMKLPPNRRCINCNSLGPQYVCTNFWTFVCMTCSGIHREFTHRVKSVSMAKFTFQEVDALQRGGNQRAKELFLKAWDPQRRLPDNSNVDKVREFIKNVYVDKRYTVEKSSDRPPRDPQSIRSHEEETRRASSFHSYSQSPPNDFHYEERRYGKHEPTLTRKPGSDHGLYKGKFSSFSSPSHSIDHGNDDRFANEGSYPRVSGYSLSSGGDPFRSPSSQGDIGSPFSENSSYFSREIPGNHLVRHNSDANIGSKGGKIRHPQRTASSGSFGSFDSTSFKSVNSMGLQEVALESEQSIETLDDKTSDFPSLPESSISTTFNGLDLFGEPFASQNVPSAPTTICDSQLPQSSLAQSVDFFQQSTTLSVPTSSEQQPSPLNRTGLSEQQSVTSSNGKTSDVVIPDNGGWATFDLLQNVPVGTENHIPGSVPSSDGKSLGNSNPFSLDQSFSDQNPACNEPSASTHSLWHDGLQNVDNTQFWNTFEDSSGQQSIPTVPKSSNQAAVLCASDANKSLGFGVYEALNNDGNVRTTDDIGPPSSSLSSNFSMPLHDFSMVPGMAGGHLFAAESKPTNPFDVPFDAHLDSSNMFLDMSSLQEVLPYNQTPDLYVGDASQSWFPQSSVPSYVPDGVTFDSPSGSLGFIVGQAPDTRISSVHAQGPVASVGGNPFA
ncbi:putative GTPase-activating protein [Handroanthus impetiginosus]|uniref:Putative GTPase-activating protein n=1 Tax=Handroanthus impetiginosus TaxID=429701 RepID=A0A2G9GKH5_9LAMI|nr:putative GTPase-activating protein [Handroanthus impetiginosus]